MTSGESFDSSAVESNGIRLEILEPDLIVLPIPEKQQSASIPVEVHVFITNTALTPFPFLNSMLVPELVGADVQALHPTRLMDGQRTTGESRGILIPYKRTIVRSLIANLSKSNNRLQLQASISDSPVLSMNPNNSWVFEPFQLGTYQLRFVYNHTGGEASLFDASTGEICRVEGSEEEPLTSPWVNLRLVEPVGTDHNAVEVDGIRFETLVPERTISVPLAQPDIDIPMQVGMLITNNTPTPLRLTSFDSLIPELIGADGLILRPRNTSVRWWPMPGESDFHLVMPGENLTLFPNARLVWQADDLFKLTVFGGGRANWSFNNLKLGAYQIHLRYRSLTAELDVLFKDLWMGMVSTPFVEFFLVQP